MQPVVSNIKVEQRRSGFGLHIASPRLSWNIVCPPEVRNWQQLRYEVEVSRFSASRQDRVYSCESSESILVPWPAAPLTSFERASVRVRSFGKSDDGTSDTEWSASVPIEASILEQETWIAKPIASPRDFSGKNDQTSMSSIRPVRLRKAFNVSPNERKTRSRLYITALGVYEAYVNGQRVGNDRLAPNWTTYQTRIQFQVFDVGPLLLTGENILVIDVAEGWYAGRLLWGKGERFIYGDRIGALAQLGFFDDEHEKTPSRWITSDQTWSCRPHAITTGGLYDGESYDLGQEYDISDLGDPAWTTAEALPPLRPHLVPPSSEPVRVTQVIKPIAILRDPDGKNILDFGQNLVGRVRIPGLSRPNGHQLIMRFAEVLEDQRLGVRPLREAKATDTITFGGNRRLKNWAPQFTFHGFRYVELTGWDAQDVDEPLTVESIVAEVIHTDMERTGFFSCSDERLNKLHQNVVWSMRGNVVGLPTDCPQRDERLGWTGDIQVFSPTACYLYDCDAFLSNWMRDVMAEQTINGGIVPLTVPDLMKNGPWPTVPQAVWGDVVIILPWNLYLNFGNVRVLQENWAGMEAHLNSVQRGSDGLWDPEQWQLGDWLDPAAPPHAPGLSRTDGTLVADQYLVHVTSLMAQIAGVLGLHEAAQKYKDEHVHLRQTFQDKYMAKSGLVVGDTQTSLSLSILFNLHSSPEQKQVAADRLARLVRYAGFRVSTGFAGTPAILHALTEGGYTPLAYRMLLEEGCPSWLYPVSMGATTIWERWDSMLEDGSINPGEMTSFNHYALGSVADWLHKAVAGMSPLEPGWKKVRISPKSGGTLTSAKGSFDSPYGTVSCEWKLINDGKEMEVEVCVPPNVKAVIDDPRGEFVVGSGRYVFKWPVPEERELWPPQPQVIAFGM